MNAQNCPQCGTQVTDDLPGGLCPTCLMEAARRSLPDPDETAALPQSFRTPSLDEMGQLFPELEIEELIGRGGMGAVYRVKQKNLDRIVALKVFLYKPNDPEFAARFQREARALARLNHPNIVTVHDFGNRGDIHYLVMEFVDGLNLREVTNEEQLSPEMALQMVPQLCDALQYAHDEGVIHRDIKPENLLLDTHGRIKIADFGLAKMTGSGNPGTLTHTRQVMGTLNYMAPEQRERPTEVDHRADIYSLGVVIYEMLTGELPLGRFQPPSEKSAVDTRLDEVVMRALEKEPDRRYQQASEFKTGITSFDAVEPVDDFVPARAPMNAAVEPVQPVKSAYRHTVEPDPYRGARRTITIMSGREKKGNWTPGNPEFVFSMMGGTCLDLTQVQQSEVRLNLFCLMGAIEVIVPHGAQVDMDGLVLMGASVDNVARHSSPINMRIKINNWGLMGGIEVRTPTADEMPEAPAPSQRVKDLVFQNQEGKAIELYRKETQASRKLARAIVGSISKPTMSQYREPREGEFTFRLLLVALYNVFATTVGFAAVVMFILHGTSLMEDDLGKILGIAFAIGCGFFWSALPYFRRLIGAGPEENTDDAVAEYYASSYIGTLILSCGMLLGLACPILFILASFETHEEDFLRAAGILCAVGCGLTYTIAHYFEEVIYGKRKE